MNFLEASSAWVKTRRSPETQRAYARDLVVWAEHCREHGADADAPTIESAVAFRNMLLKTMASLTVRRRLAALSAAYRAVLPGVANPFDERAIPRPANSKFHRTEAVSDEDARKVLEAARECGESPLRDFALLHVLWCTGIRRVSAVSIRRDQIRRGKNSWTVWVYVKGGKEAPAELSAEAVRAVKAWLAIAPDSPWLFCTLVGGRALTPQGVTNIVARAAKRAGVHVHPHQFRSAFITRAIDAGISLPRVQAAAHHEDPRSTMRYDDAQRGVGVVAELEAFRRGDTKE